LASEAEAAVKTEYAVAFVSISETMDVHLGSLSTEVASGPKADSRAEDCHYLLAIGHVWTASFAYLLWRK